MKPYDSKGEYTPAEVKAALSGTSGTRQMSYRYERLDSNNNFIEDIDYIQSCTINNDSLADIKRTAKFDILDTGTINYLSDRIKPYVRLAMPSSPAYTDFIKQMQPSSYISLDSVSNTGQLLVATSGTGLPDGQTYNTFATAYVMNDSHNYAGSHLVGDGVSMRKELWVTVTLTGPNPVRFMMSSDTNVFMDIYTQTGSTQASLVKLGDTYVGVTNITTAMAYSATAAGTYYMHLYTTNTNSTVLYASIFYDRGLVVNEYVTGTNVGVFGPASITSGLVRDGGNALIGSPVVQSGADSAPDIGGVDSCTANMWINIPKGTFGVAQDVLYSALSMANVSLNLLVLSSADGHVHLGMDVGQNNSSVRYTLSDTAAISAFEGTHNITWTYTTDLISNTMTVNVFSDAVQVCSSTLALPTVLATDLQTPTVGMTIGSTSAVASNITIDEITQFASRVLTVNEMRNILTEGQNAKPPRSGYVEWPQGVFVLSSPKRTMVEGNYVHREVEGYDQLSVLKEGSVDIRHTLDTYQYYTDGILSLLPYMSATATSLSDPRWLAKNGATITSATSATLTAVGSAYPNIGLAGGLMKSGAFSLSAKLTPSVVSGDGFVVTATNVNNGNYYLQISYSSGGNVTVWEDYNTVLRQLYSATYSATTHAYWRIRESGGKLLAEFSSNGTTYTTAGGTSQYVYGSETPLQVDMYNYAGGASSTASISNVSIYGQSTILANITRSQLKPPTAMEWAPGTPNLRIINDILSCINYGSATFDEDGVFTAKPYIAPQYRTPEFVYATDSQSVVTGDVNQTMDIFGIPNKWIVTVSEPDRPALSSTYVNSNPLSPTSTVSRGRTIVDFRTEQSAPDQTTLDAQVARLAFEASQVYEEIEFDTALMPIHQDFDIYTVKIDGLAVADKYAEHAWSMDLSNGAVMHHKIRKVVIV